MNKATPALTWGAPTAITYGTALSATQLNATASVPGTFVYMPKAGTVLSGGTKTLSVIFTPADATNYTTTSKTVSITVNLVTPGPGITPVPPFNYAIFATDTNCGSLTISSGSSTNSYNSATSGNLGLLTPPLLNSGGAVATFGNVNLSGSGFVLGNVYAPGYNLIDPAVDSNIWWPTIKQPASPARPPMDKPTILRTRAVSLERQMPRGGLLM